MRRFIAIILGAVVLAGCERDIEQELASREEARVVKDVVARVGKGSIGAADVRSLMRTEGIGAEAAVQQLVDEEILTQEAARLGFVVDGEGELGVERLMVRALLHDLEEKNTAESVSDEELREDYARYQDRFITPERRRSWHILVKDSGEEAKALASSILRDLRSAKDPRSVFERYEDGDPEGSEIEVLAEDLPAVPRNAGLKKPYKNALFEAKSEGPVSDVVRTSYGWHAIVVAEILPEERRSPADVEEESRDRISQAKRITEIVRIVKALQAEGLGKYNDEGVARLLSMAGLPERAD